MNIFEFFLKILFIYSIEIETARERGNTSRGSGRGRSRLIAQEPDVGLDLITPGSRPEPKADALTAVPPRRPYKFFSNMNYLSSYSHKEGKVANRVYRTISGR